MIYFKVLLACLKTPTFRKSAEHWKVFDTNFNPIHEPGLRKYLVNIRRIELPSLAQALPGNSRICC